MDFSPEWKLLLGCAKANLTTEDLRLIEQELVRPDLDWDHVTRAACAHGIAPLIHHGLQQSGVTNLLPPTAAQRLRSSYYGNTARNSLLYDELRKVLEAFREEAIEVIVLKGAALAEAVYPNRTLRPMTDVDLLVRKEQLAKVETKLVDMGYSLEEGAKPKDFYREHHYHLVFSKLPATKIEIHWHITRPNSPFRIDIDGLWERAQPIVLGGVEALALSPEDLLLHICQHMHKHKLFGGIRPLCDIAHVVEYYKNAIDWTEFRDRSYRWGISPYVYLVLSLAKELLDAHISSSFLKNFEPAGFDRTVIPWAKERLLDCESSPISRNVVQLCWKGHRFGDRLAALGSALAPEVIAQSYGLPHDSNRIPLRYYPLRIKYLLTRYGPVLWHLMSGDQKTRGALEREDKQLRLTKWLSSGYQ